MIVEKNWKATGIILIVMVRCSMRAGSSKMVHGTILALQVQDFIMN